MKRNQILILLCPLVVLFCFACSSCDYNISNLQSKTIKFNDLPQEVSAFYKSLGNIESRKMETRQLACLDDSSRYEITRILIGPWTAYIKLVDLNQNLSYHIERGLPRPYVIFKNKLYIPNEFYTFIFIEDYAPLEFTAYTLKGK